MAILLCLQVSTRLLFSEQPNSWRGEWIGEIPNVGKLAIELNEFNTNRPGKLFWLCETLDVRWEAKSNSVVLYHTSGYGGFSKNEPTAVLKLQGIEGDRLQLVTFGLLTQERLSSLGSMVFTRSPGGSLANLADFRRKGNQYERFSKNGQLQPLPTSLPSGFMDVTVLLFRFRDHDLFSLLKHPNLSSDVLSLITADCLDPKTPSGGALHSLPPILAAHPHISQEDLQRLFDLPPVYELMAPIVWRAAALNPTAPPSFHEIYIDRIRKGDARTRVWVARDPEAPRDAWEATLEPGESLVLQEFTRNSKAPADLLKQIALKKGENSPGLAGNASTPAEVLEKSSYSTDKQVLWSLLKNPAAPTSAVNRALHTLAKSPSANERSTAASDGRLSSDLFTNLVQDPNIFVRIMLAMNNSAPFEVLCRLANDGYRPVSERARGNLQGRFRDKLAEIQKQWLPLDQLDPNDSLNSAFYNAVEKADISRARELWKATEDPETKVVLESVVNNILRTNFAKLAPLLLEAIKEAGPSGQETMVGSAYLKPEHVSWMDSHELFSLKSAEQLISLSASRGKSELIRAALVSKPGKQVSDMAKSKALFEATSVCDLKSVETLLKYSASPTLFVQERYVPLGGTNHNLMVPERMNAADLAAKTYFIAGLRLLDLNGKYKQLLSDFDHQFPSTKDSRYLGVWDNNKDGFYQIAFFFAEDASGSMGTSAYGGAHIVWKESNPNTVVVYLIGQSGIAKDHPMTLVYDPGQEQLVWERPGIETERFHHKKKAE